MPDFVGTIGSNITDNKDSSKSKEKEWWEKEYDALKDQFDYSEITIEQYIGGLENLLGKLDKGLRCIAPKALKFGSVAGLFYIVN